MVRHLRVEGTHADSQWGTPGFKSEVPTCQHRVPRQVGIMCSHGTAAPQYVGGDLQPPSIQPHPSQKPGGGGRREKEWRRKNPVKKNIWGNHSPLRESVETVDLSPGKTFTCHLKKKNDCFIFEAQRGVSFINFYYC